MNKIDKGWEEIITENSTQIAKLNVRLTEMEEREKQLIMNLAFTQNFIRDALPGHFVGAALNYTGKGTEEEKEEETVKLFSEYGDRFDKVITGMLKKQWQESSPPNNLLYNHMRKEND